MNENTEKSPVSEVPTTPGEVKLPAENVTIINIDELKDNSIMIINVAVSSPAQKMAVAPIFTKLLAPYAMDLKKKHITVMLMAVGESIDMVSEEDMSAAGWEKTKKSLIINPFHQ